MPTTEILFAVSRADAKAWARIYPRTALRVRILHPRRPGLYSRFRADRVYATDRARQHPCLDTAVRTVVANRLPSERYEPKPVAH